MPGLLPLSGPVAVRVEAAVPVVPGVVASVAGGDDAASQLQQQLLGGRLRQGVGVGRAQRVSLGGAVGLVRCRVGASSLGSPPARMVSMLPGAQASLFSSMA